MGIFPKSFEDETDLGQALFCFWDTTQLYPAWLHHGNEGHVWPLVSEAEGSTTNKRQDIVLQNGNRFTFTLKDVQSFDAYPRYNLEIYYKKKIIASLYTQLDFYHSLSGVEFINIGDWTTELSDFSKWKKARDEEIERELDVRWKQELKKKQEKTID